MAGFSVKLPYLYGENLVMRPTINYHIHIFKGTLIRYLEEFLTSYLIAIKTL
jgi:hypothetical protein